MRYSWRLRALDRSKNAQLNFYAGMSNPGPNDPGGVALSRQGAARSNSKGELILLDAQDRRLWNRQRITEGLALVEQRPLGSRRFGPYTLQAAIAAVHAEAPEAAATDWAQIVGLYELLARIELPR